MSSRKGIGGRPRKPSALRVLHGDYEMNPNRQNTKEPKPKRGKPICPKSITGEGRKEWNNVCRLLAETGVLTKDLGSALSVYCRSHILMLKAFAHLDKHGTVLVVEDKDGTKRTVRNPYCADMREHSAICIKMLTEFGLTPSSRTRVQIENAVNSKTELARKYLA